MLASEVSVGELVRIKKGPPSLCGRTGFVQCTLDDAVEVMINSWTKVWVEVDCLDKALV